ncbi:MAG: DUF1735 domain-containing protein [Bacteroidales bacterium]|nr:DUF1735 domain-containing protein [Bacteroidales bacterium]
MNIIKFKNIALFAATLAIMPSCEENHINDNLYEPAVYLVDNMTNGICSTDKIYDIQDQYEYPVYAYCSGFNEGDADVSISANPGILDYYNTTTESQYKLLPDDCYKITTASSKISNRKAKMIVNFDIKKIIVLSNVEDYSDLSEYVLPIALKSDAGTPVSTKDTLLGFTIVSPIIEKASAIISSTSIVDNQFKVTLKLPFENAWKAEYDIDFGSVEMNEAATGLGNSLPAFYNLSELPQGTTIENEDVRTMEPGTSEVTYTVTLPTQTTPAVQIYKVVLNNFKLDGVEIPVDGDKIQYFMTSNMTYSPTVDRENTANDNAYFGKGLSNYAAWKSFTLVDRSKLNFVSESANNPVSSAFDGQTSTFWDNNWGGGYGPSTIPFNAVLDLGYVTDVDAIEVWRRPGTYVTDTKAFEVYAADQVDANGETIQYGKLSYLGLVDFGNSNNVNRLMYQMINNAKTQYLILRFVQANRTNCISVAEFNLWHR